MFQRYGVRSVTMDDLANKIAISKKTIYQHFKDKKEVVTESVRFMMAQDQKDMQEVTAKSKDTVHEMVLVSSHIKEMMKEVNPSLLYDLKKYHPDAWEVYSSTKDACFTSMILDALKRGQEEGYFRKEMNVEIISRMRMAQIETGFDPEIFPTSDFDIPQVQLQMFEHFTYGVVTKKGRELFEKYSQELEQQTL